VADEKKPIFVFSFGHKAAQLTVLAQSPIQ